MACGNERHLAEENDSGVGYGSWNKKRRGSRKRTSKGEKRKARDEIFARVKGGQTIKNPIR